MNQILRLSGAAVLVTAALVTGCANYSNSNSVYSPGQAQREQVVRFGVVEGVREVMIQGGSTGAGTIAGGAIGGVAASSPAENRLTQRRGLEITVRLEDGDMRAITQEADEVFRPGDRVRLLSSGGTTRVTH